MRMSVFAGQFVSMINKPHFPMRPTSADRSSSSVPTVAGEPRTIVVTIDGPAGAGKSSVSRRLAQRLGFEFLDTGAMYRCVTLATMLLQIDTNDERSVEDLAEQLTIELAGPVVRMNGEDVSAAIRSPDVSMAIKAIADNVAVRRILSQLQRRWTLGRCVVTEGRDQGTDVFPDSPCKIFLTASCEERARRRSLELSQRGVSVDFASILEQQNLRDHQDRSRAVGALRKAADAIEISTDGKSLDEVVEELLVTVLQRLSEQGIEPLNAGDPAESLGRAAVSAADKSLGVAAPHQPLSVEHFAAPKGFETQPDGSSPKSEEQQ